MKHGRCGSHRCQIFDSNVMSQRSLSLEHQWWGSSSMASKKTSDYCWDGIEECEPPTHPVNKVKGMAAPQRGPHSHAKFNTKTKKCRSKQTNKKSAKALNLQSFGQMTTTANSAFVTNYTCWLSVTVSMSNFHWHCKFYQNTTSFILTIILLSLEQWFVILTGTSYH